MSLQAALKCLLVAFFLSAIIGQSEAKKVNQQLFLFGGGKRSPEAMSEMLQQSNSKSPKVLIITWASSVPEDSFNSIKADFIDVGVSTVEHAPTIEHLKNKEEQESFIALAKNFEIIFFGGGDQNRILDFFVQNPNVAHFFQSRFRKGTIFAGTSAGTAIMGHLAVCGSDDETKISPETTCLRNGLGLAPNGVLVDQHFIRRSRYNRLFSALIYNNNFIEAFGVDEDSAIWLKNNQLTKVFGMAVHVSKKRKGLLVNILGATPQMAQ